MRQYKTDSRRIVLALLLAAAISSYPAPSRAEVSIGVNNVLQVAATENSSVQNCQSLLDALAGITDSSRVNRYVVRLEPGTYRCSTPIVLPEGVSLQGMAGRAYTTILSTVDSALFGAVHMQSHTELANVMVIKILENPTNGGIAVSAWSLSLPVNGVRLTNVRLVAGPNPPNRHSLHARNAVVTVKSSILTQISYLDSAAVVNFHYSRINGVSVNGGSLAVCRHTDDLLWLELNQFCGP
ncbi:MAG: hypothetical protein ACE5GX_06465 [Thermoanaerobaculia bacterium]